MSANFRATSSTQQQQQGIDKLNTRIEAGEMVIFETDKSTKTTKSSRENHRLQGEPNIRNETPVEGEEEKEKSIGSHMSST